MAISTRFETQKIFRTADKKLGKHLVGADFVMVVRDLPHMTFLVKSHTLPMLKNELVEYTTTHGAKSGQEGYIQTWNEIQVTFSERDSIIAKTSIERLMLEDKNNGLKIDFYAGRTIDKTRIWGHLVDASFYIEDNPDTDSEDTTTPFVFTATIRGHYEPSKITEFTSIADSVINLGK